MLNAGILHRVGPNRLYVTAARELEQLGFHVLRFDLWGIGDSQGSAKSPAGGTFRDDTETAMEEINHLLGINRFILAGICMGAKIALDVAWRDPRVDSLMLMEGIYVRSVRYHVSRLLDPWKWSRLFSGRSHLVNKLQGRLLRHPTESPHGRESAVPSAARSQPVLLLDDSDEHRMKVKLHAILARGSRVLLAFRNGNEIRYNYRLRQTSDEIVAIGLPPGLDVAFVPFADHTFTPVISQQLLLRVLVKWLAKAYPIPCECTEPLAAAKCG